MRRAALALIAVCVGLAASAVAEPSDGADILKKAQTAISAVKAVTYEAEFSSQWLDTDEPRRRVGKVTLVRNMAALPKLRADASWLPSSDDGQPEIQVASDSTSVSVVDHAKQRYHHEMGPRAALQLTRVAGLLVLEFVDRDPFAAELDAEVIASDGTEKIGDVDCYVVQVKYAKTNSEARWYFGTQDYLPRRVERSATLPMGKRSQTLTLKSLVVNPTVDEEQFRLSQPEGYESGQPAQTTQPAGRPNPVPSLLAAGTEAPDWSLKTPEGTTVTLKELRGKVVVLDFWATWCGPCKTAMPGVQKLHEKFKDRPVAVYGVSTKERGNPAAYMKQKGYTYGLLLKGDGVAAKYGVRGIPAFFIVGKDGKIVFSGAGAGNEEALEKIVEQALKETE